tara:strand:+ start:782 stop:1324 length:543 start_codon:yes stop_codon:yes gene_type:complete
MTDLSMQTNRKEFINGKSLTLEQLDTCLSNKEVQKRFERYTSVGRDRNEGPMTEPEALEEALMDVYVGAKSRGYRVYRKYATDEHVKRLKRIKSETHTGMTVKEYVPDMVALRARLRKTSDLSLLSNLLVAEQAKRNDENEVRPAAVKAIVARIASVEKNAEAIASHGGASEKDLAEAGK